MNRFTITTDRAEYKAEQQGDEGGVWIVVIKFKSGVEATYNFKNYANTAVAQRIFNIDKYSMG